MTCGRNMNTVKTVYDRRLVDPDEYQSLIKHSTTCRSCARNLQLLKEAELRQHATPQPVKLKFGTKEKPRR